MKCAVSDFDRTLYVERMIGEEDKNAVLNWQSLCDRHRKEFRDHKAYF